MFLLIYKALFIRENVHCGIYSNSNSISRTVYDCSLLQQSEEEFNFYGGAKIGHLSKWTQYPLGLMGIWNSMKIEKRI